MEPEPSPPNSSRKEILQLVKSHLLLHPRQWRSEGTVLARGLCAWQGGTWLVTFVIPQFKLFPKQTFCTWHHSMGLIIDPLDKGWEAEPGSPNLCPGAAKLIVILSVCLEWQ